MALDERARAGALARQAASATPAAALGRLGELAVWLAAVTGEERPAVHARVVVAAADRAGAGSMAAASGLRALAGGDGAAAILARETDAGLVLVDAGIAADTSDLGVVRAGIGPGRDVRTEPALNVGGVAAAVDCGRELAAGAARDGITVLVGGALGNANATGVAALAAALTGCDPAGLGHDVAAAVALHAPHARGPLGLLRRLGGGDVAVLCGLALGAGEHGLGFVCDGVSATAAAAVAAAVEPDLRPRLLAGHRSPEPGHAALLAHLGLEPVLDLRMDLGQGAGATAALAILRLAVALHDG